MITAYFDGACAPRNPGGTAAYGIAIFKDDKLIHTSSSYYSPYVCKTSNNMAEYNGLKAILTHLLNKNLNKEEILIKGDSQLVINQMMGAWSIKKGIYYSDAITCRDLIKNHFPNIFFKWIPREENTFTDKICNDKLEGLGIKDPYHIR